MGAYVYTPRTETKTLITGEVVARLTYAYKDFHVYSNTPKSFLMQASRLENAGERAAKRHNENNVRLLARCDKFEVGAPVFKIKDKFDMHFKYLDHMTERYVHVGYLAKEGREWFISNDDRSAK